MHAHQTVAAGKPLNQGTKQLQPKTPGARAPKTPFKVPLNDENDPLAFGKKTIKATGRRNENLKPAKDAFVTPMGKDPSERASGSSYGVDWRDSGQSSAGTIRHENDQCQSEDTSSYWHEQAGEDQQENVDSESEENRSLGTAE